MYAWASASPSANARLFFRHVMRRRRRRRFLSPSSAKLFLESAEPWRLASSANNAASTMRAVRMTSSSHPTMRRSRNSCASASVDTPSNARSGPGAMRHTHAAFHHIAVDAVVHHPQGAREAQHTPDHLCADARLPSRSPTSALQFLKRALAPIPCGPAERKAIACESRPPWQLRASRPEDPPHRAGASTQSR